MITMLMLAMMWITITVVVISDNNVDVGNDVDHNESGGDQCIGG